VALGHPRAVVFWRGEDGLLIAMAFIRRIAIERAPESELPS
jgi:hypothetical protein